MPLDERPEPLEVLLPPRRIDDEVAGDAVLERSRDRNAVGGVIDGGVLDETFEAFVGGRFQPEEDVELVGDRPPGRQQIGMPRDEIDAALHQDPLLADAAALQFGGQRQAARRVIPEQIVRDEDVVADVGEVGGHGIDRSLAHGAIVQLPDGTEGTAERTASRRFDQPDRPVRQTGVLPAIPIDEPP